MAYNKNIDNVKELREVADDRFGEYFYRTHLQRNTPYSEKEVYIKDIHVSLVLYIQQPKEILQRLWFSSAFQRQHKVQIRLVILNNGKLIERYLSQSIYM